MNVRAVVGVALGAVLLTSDSARGEDGSCQKWTLDVVCSTSAARAVLGDEFTASVVATNTGQVALVNVTLRLRGDQGAPCVSGTGGGVSLLVEKLEPGQSKELSARFAAETIGTGRILGSARDSMAWASGSCACTVDIYGLTAIQSEMTDKAVDGTERGVFRKGDEYLYVLSVRNDIGTAATPGLIVSIELPPEVEFVSGKTDQGIAVEGKGQSAKTVRFVLAPPNQTMSIEFRVRVLKVPPSRLVKARANVETTAGIILATDSESTTIQ